MAADMVGTHARSLLAALCYVRISPRRKLIGFSSFPAFASNLTSHSISFQSYTYTKLFKLLKRFPAIGTG